jgi:hypothetical protein
MEWTAWTEKVGYRQSNPLVLSSVSESNFNQWSEPADLNCRISSALPRS